MPSKNTPTLLVDDSQLMRQLVTNVLVKEGYTDIQTASNGKEALAKINEAIDPDKMYKIIFLDWDMPEMDGLELLKICRANARLNKTAIIMLTAMSDKRDVITMMRLGATSYLAKPVSGGAILRTLDQVEKWFVSQESAP